MTARPVFHALFSIALIANPLFLCSPNPKSLAPNLTGWFIRVFTNTHFGKILLDIMINLDNGIFFHNGFQHNSNYF